VKNSRYQQSCDQPKQPGRALGRDPKERGTKRNLMVDGDQWDPKTKETDTNTKDNKVRLMKMIPYKRRKMASTDSDKDKEVDEDKGKSSLSSSSSSTIHSVFAKFPDFSQHGKLEQFTCKVYIS
jgi:hypothetical protein